MIIADLTGDHVPALSRFFAALPERDRTFIEDHVTDPRTIARLPGLPSARWVALDGTDVAEFAAVRPLPGWSAHVGTLHLIVYPDHRRAGIGAALARHALARSSAAGLRKVQVELAAGHDSAIAMFAGRGFTGEAPLRDHIRDRRGQYRDLVVLAHHVDEARAAMDAAGAADELAN